MTSKSMIVDFNMEKKNEVLLRFGIPTKNDRIYLESELTRERIWNKCGDGSYFHGTMLEKLNGTIWYKKIIRVGEYENSVKRNNPRLYGELGHPERFEVSVKNISHTIENVRIENKSLIGDIKILDTKAGGDLKNILKKIPIVFSPRASGVLNENKEVTEYTIFTFDAIPKPESIFY